jgi:L-2,4-diaminobutyric acid acetyltransferase
MSNEEMQHEGILYRTPTIEDGASIWQLARDLGTLDLNSTYCYLLLGKHFSETCAVAVKNGEIIGFVTGYLVPHRADTLFVWQIGITDTMRGQGLAIRLLQELLQRDVCRSVRFLEATIGSTNQASRALFTALAQRLNTDFSERPCFDAPLFPEGNHEAENLFRIGPFSVFRHNKLQTKEPYHAHF